MNRLLSLLIACVFLSAGVSAKEKDIVVTTDKFTGKSTVTMKQMSIGTFSDKTHFSGLVNLYLAACTLDKQPKPTALVIYSYATNWQFLGGADVYLLIDGEKIDLGHFASVRGNADVVGNGVSLSETIAAPVDRSIFEKIASAKIVEMKIGPYVTKLSSKGIERVGAFLSALPSASR
jgi:hypothetical protein